VLGHDRPARHRHVNTRTSVVVAEFKGAFGNAGAIHIAVLVGVGIRHDQVARHPTLEIRLTAFKFDGNEGSDALLGGIEQRLFARRIWKAEDGGVGSEGQSTGWDDKLGSGAGVGPVARADFALGAVVQPSPRLLNAFKSQVLVDIHRASVTNCDRDRFRCGVGNAVKIMSDGPKLIVAVGNP